MQIAGHKELSRMVFASLALDVQSITELTLGVASNVLRHSPECATDLLPL